MVFILCALYLFSFELYRALSALAGNRCYLNNNNTSSTKILFRVSSSWTERVTDLCSRFRGNEYFQMIQAIQIATSLCKQKRPCSAVADIRKGVCSLIQGGTNHLSRRQLSSHERRKTYKLKSRTIPAWAKFCSQLYHCNAMKSMGWTGIRESREFVSLSLNCHLDTGYRWEQLAAKGSVRWFILLCGLPL